MKSGCYQCTDRKVGCHSKCEKYKGWKAEYDAKAAEIRAARDREHEIASVSIASRIKALKRRDNWREKER
jgi:hypothetical protein